MERGVIFQSADQCLVLNLAPLAAPALSLICSDPGAHGYTICPPTTLAAKVCTPLVEVNQAKVCKSLCGNDDNALQNTLQNTLQLVTQTTNICTIIYKQDVLYTTGS